MTIFTNAEINGVRGIFASTNEGVTWTQINDAAHEYGVAAAAMTGDPQIFGTVYIGTNGRGIVMGTGTPPVSAGTGSFTLKPSAAALSIAPGASTTDTITITDVSPFNGSVTLAASGLPAGVTAAFATNPTTSTSVLTLTASSTATTGAATVTITGTSGSLTATTTIALTVTTAGSFTIKPSATTLSIAQGASGTDTITVTDVSPFNGSVTLAASGLPAGVTASFAPNPATSTSVLTLTASCSAVVATNTITITGTSGSLSATTTIALIDTASTTCGTGSFTLKPSAATLSTAQGASGTDTITVTDVSPFTGSVTLAASGLPAGVTASFATNPTTSTSVLTLTASGTAAAGTSTITITGTSGSLSATTTIALTVTGSCTATAIVPYISVSGTWTEESTATVASTTTVVDLGPQPTSGGTWAWTGPNGFTSTARQINSIALSAGANVYTATYTNASGCKSMQAFTVTVTSSTGSFSLARSASALSLAQGASGTDTITVTDVSPFNGSVTLAASGLPTGVTASFATNPTTGSSVLTLTASSTATVGTSTVTITGTSGSLSATTIITLTVSPAQTGSFTLSASGALSVVQGSSTTLTITVTDVSPFNGAVTITYPGSSGSPVPVTISGCGSPITGNGSCVLTITASSTATVGSTTFIVTGTSGTLSASTTIALTVSPATSGAKCTVDYVITPQNSTAFGAAITLVNNSSTAWTSWTLTWAFANGQTVSSLWNGNETQSGANVTVTNESYNGSVAAGGSLTGVGFNGTWNGATNAIPTAFSINGTACTVN
jgi:hypothetical protein